MYPIVLTLESSAAFSFDKDAALDYLLEQIVFYYPQLCDQCASPTTLHRDRRLHFGKCLDPCNLIGLNNTSATVSASKSVASSMNPANVDWDNLHIISYISLIGNEDNAFKFCTLYGLVDTQQIERMWKTLKSVIPKGTNRNLKSSYLVVFIFKQRNNWFLLQLGRRIELVLNTLKTMKLD
jgi:hypothetical protein